jgi:hypothetical protein
MQNYETASKATVEAAGYTHSLAYEFHTIEYDENGTPVALRTVQFYEAYKDEGGKRVYYVGDGGNTSAIKIKEGDTERVIFLVNSSAIHRKLEPTTDGSQLYIKEVDAKFAGKYNQLLDYTNGDKDATKSIPIYELGTGTGDYTWTFLEDEATEGYTLLGNYKIGAGITETVGGWQLSNGGLTLEMTDLMYSKNKTASRLYLGTMGEVFGYTEASDDFTSYTLELILDYGATKEQDNYIFSGTRTLYEGESAYQVGFQIGSWVEYCVVFAPEFASGATDGFSNHHITWQYGAANSYDVANTATRFTLL